MTIREYISQKLQAFNVTEAFFADFVIASDLSLDDEYTFEVAPTVGKALAENIAELILSPRLSNVNESGFSMSWDFSELGKYYMYLCNRWGIKPNDEAVAASGISVIVDRTNMW